MGASIAWLDPIHGLTLGDRMGSGRYRINIGKEEIAEIGGSAGDAKLRGAPLSALEPATLDLCLDTNSGRRTGSYRLTLERKIFGAESQKELLLMGLQLIERARPGVA